MKIKHLLNESHEHIYEAIVESKFFKENYEDKIKYAVENDIEFQYLEEIAWLFHASDKLPEEAGIVNQRLRERPRDSSPLFHSMVNRYAMEKVNVPVRNLIFSHTMRHKVRDYGDDIYVLFPLDNNYKLFYADSINDMTEHYTVSINNISQVNKKFDEFCEKYGLEKYEYEIPSSLAVGIYSSESEEELKEKVGNMFKMIDYSSEKFSQDELTDKLTDYILQDFNAKASDYAEHLKVESKLVKRDEEYMLYGGNIAVLSTEGNYTSAFSRFKDYLVKKYSQGL